MDNVIEANPNLSDSSVNVLNGRIAQIMGRKAGIAGLCTGRRGDSSKGLYWYGT